MLIEKEKENVLFQAQICCVNHSIYFRSMIDSMVIDIIHELFELRPRENSSSGIFLQSICDEHYDMRRYLPLVCLIKQFRLILIHILSLQSQVVELSFQLKELIFLLHQ
jgi:hypothetical protein